MPFSWPELGHWQNALDLSNTRIESDRRRCNVDDDNTLVRSEDRASLHYELISLFYSLSQEALIKIIKIFAVRVYWIQRVPLKYLEAVEGRLNRGRALIQC